ncbi:ComEC/Rec2 family competence protein [Paenibacillus polymyxa]|uniref:ComEC/Rec2 family competence protein n=1 Tax=Paenibacillus polymyxa TaxID=1406 RepID=UPI0025B650D5|nr:ComEC/Rec2 family competence protein [Paenibacillus polymyxa]MDN4082722.1 ComEC/Rec2 family competence protein [Paenibacillus polymyxa]MDN4088408.1 ComEC/Rec2 family competence protein [Paenibacillus polymyxa]MDN4107857.1 ComEC/Rec2 family competence protein [Paenibacillus polymyxa]
MVLWAGITLVFPLIALLMKIPIRHMVLLWIALSGGGFHWFWHDTHNVSSIPGALHVSSSVIEDMPVQAAGFIASEVEIDGDRAQFEMRVTSIHHFASHSNKDEHRGSISEQVIVHIKLAAKQEQQLAAAWQRGDAILLRGSIKVPAKAGNFGSFDYSEYLHTQGIHWLIKGAGAASLQRQKASLWNRYTLLRWNDQLREQLGQKMESAFTSLLHAGYMKGLILGVTDELDPATYNEFTQLGLTHILAISGMHVAVYAATLLYLLKLLRVSRETSLTIVMVLIPVYVLLTGASPSVVRAGIMAMIGLFAARRGLLKDGLNILSVSALLMLLWNPYYLLSVSFQLSFLVTGGLLIYMPLMKPFFAKWPLLIGGEVAITITAQLVSFPMTVFYFNQFSILSFAANFLLVPLITYIVLPLGTVAMGMAFLWGEGARILAWPAEQLNDLTFSLVKWMNVDDAYVSIWPSSSILWVLAYYAALYSVLYWLKTWLISRRQTGDISDVKSNPIASPVHTGLAASAEWAAILQTDHEPKGAGKFAHRQWDGYRHVALALSGIAWLGILCIGYQSPSERNTGVVQYLDVGQGDSILITTPGGKHILVDGGGTMDFATGKNAWRKRIDPYEVGADTIVPLLKQRGVHRLDAVILTHGDHDHAGGLQAIFDQIPVTTLFFNGTLTDKAPFRKLLNTALNKQIKLYGAHHSMEWEPDRDTTIRFLYPFKLEENESGQLPVMKEQNHYSVAMILEMEGVSFLFTGDMDDAAESLLLSELTHSSSHVKAQGAIGAARKAVDVMKVAHHGSKYSTSEEWLSYWQPKVSVISVGASNTYGHPNQAVLERLAEVDSAIYRTDTMGEVQIRAQQGKLSVRYQRRREQTNSK